MIFRTPIPFREALESRAVRMLLPTEFRTRLLQEIPAALRERAVFSAGVTNAEFLQAADDGINALITGTGDRATQRAELKKLLESLGYQPPSEDERDTLTDLSSDRRLNLILDTGEAQAFGYGSFKQGQQEAVLDMWPAQELFDTNPGLAENRRNWAKTWSDNGGVFYGGRMIALKNDPIWTAISRFGTPYPPFDFESYWDVRDITRREAIELGVIERDTVIFPQDRGFNSDLQATPEVRSSRLADALQQSLQDQGIAAGFVDGVLKLTGGGRG
jgi:hypothetical protein